MEVTYFAQVTEQAVTGITGNKNSVTLDYNNNPGEETEAGPVEVTVYSFNIKVEKFTENGGKIPLDGAEFELYTDEAVRNKIGGPVATDEAGNLSFQKLDAGTYYLKETKSPEGYTLLADAIKVEIIDPDGTGNFTLKVNDKEVDTTTGSFVTGLSRQRHSGRGGREPQRLQPSRDRRGRYRSVPDHRRGRYCDGFCCSCKKDEKRELIIYETQEIMHYHPVFYPVFVFPGCHGLSFCDAAL